MREYDWSKTSLGPQQEWPRALKTALRIVLTSRQPMFVWWGDELINLYNDAYVSILGGKHPYALGQPAREVWSEIWDQIGPRAQRAMFRNEGTYDESLRLIMNRYGYKEETYYTFSYSPVPNDEGGTGGIFCANTDNTARIIGERQLALLREQATRTMDTRTIDEACLVSSRCLAEDPYDLPFALLYLLEPDHRSVVLEGSTGIARGHVAAPDRVALSDSSLWPFEQMFEANIPCEIPQLDFRFGKLPCGAWEEPPMKAVLIPIPASGKTGRAGALVAGLNPYRLLDDNYRGFLELVARQISAAIANAHAYEEERQKSEALAALDRAKTVFFSNVSHELRTPLTLMLGPMEEVLGNGSLAATPDSRELVEVSHRNGLRLLKLVNSLLDFSRIEAGRVQANYEPTDLAAFTADIAATFRSVIEREGLQFIVACETSQQPAFVDRDMWEKIVLNLISNAFKYTFKGRITVGLRESDDGTATLLTVSDTGIGIAAKELPRLFERFHRVEGAHGRTYEGTGIGLALVQELVRLHAGAVWVESEPGKGTTFSVQIPLGSGHLPGDRIQPLSFAASLDTRMADAYVEEAEVWTPSLTGETLKSRDIAVNNGSGHSKRHVLLADDNADMREYVARLLTPDYVVTSVSNGRDALVSALQNPPDLVLSDIMMPHLDGFELLRALRANSQTNTVPVILLSARAGEESRVEGLEAGADDYLVKPFTARELVARVGTHMEMSRTRREATERERLLRQQAEASRAQTERILDSITDGFVSFDSALRFTYANARALQMMGGNAQAILGRTLTELFPVLTGTLVDRELQAALREQRPKRLEYFDETSRRWFDLGLYPSIDGLSLFFQDSTERKQAEEALKSSNEALKRANFDLEQFAFSASHDLQEPLRMVAVYSQLFARKYKGQLDEQGEMIVGHCVEGAKRMEMLIHDLLEYTRAAQSPIHVSAPVSIEAVLDECIAILRASIEETNALITWGRLAEVKVEHVHLQQIFLNLISNALKYRSGEPPRIHVDARQDGQFWLLSVKDNGIGIEPQYQNQVFGLFKRLHNVGKYPGTGLGLAICKKLVERYGGRIWVDSTLGEGSTFLFTLPA